MPANIKFAGAGANNTIIYVFTTISSGQHAKYGFTCTPNDPINVTTTYASTLNPTSVSGITVTGGTAITGGATIADYVLPTIAANSSGTNKVVTIVTATLGDTALAASVSYSFGLLLANNA